MIAFAGPNAYGAAWYRLFPASAPGFGFVDEQTPELTIAVVPSHRGHGGGGELLEALLERARADGFAHVSLSAEPGQTAFYEKHGFREHGRDDRTVTMVAEPLTTLLSMDVRCRGSRRGAGRVYGRDPRRAARREGRLHREGAGARRHLPARRLHPDEGVGADRAFRSIRREESFAQARCHVGEADARLRRRRTSGRRASSSR